MERQQTTKFLKGTKGLGFSNCSKICCNYSFMKKSSIFLKTRINTTVSLQVKKLCTFLWKVQKPNIFLKTRKNTTFSLKTKVFVWKKNIVKYSKKFYELTFQEKVHLAHLFFYFDATSANSAWASSNINLVFCKPVGTLY